MRGKFSRGFKRISRVGTWESLSDAAIYISIVTFAATLFFDLLIYLMYCFMEDYSPFSSGMAHSQSVFLFAMVMHILLTTAIITIVVVVVYDQVITDFPNTQSAQAAEAKLAEINNASN